MRKLGEPLTRRLFGGERARGRLEWAERALRRHGVLVVVVGRFIPGGRTATTFAAGTLSMAWRRFILADVAAGALWAVYAAMLGYAGGAAFRDSFWKPLAGVARRRGARGRRHRGVAADPAPARAGRPRRRGG